MSEDKKYKGFIGKLDVDYELVMEFFVVFARFEYALKRANRAKYNGKMIEIKWNDFAAELDKSFDKNKNENLEKAVSYLINNPPKKQILDSEGKLSWTDNERKDEVELLVWLVKLVKCIRNNLFHGGKFPGVPIEEPARNKELLRSSLEVLYECLDLAGKNKNCEEVKKIFEEDIFV